LCVAVRLVDDWGHRRAVDRAFHRPAAASARSPYLKVMAAAAGGALTRTSKPPAPDIPVATTGRGFCPREDEIGGAVSRCRLPNAQDELGRTSPSHLTNSRSGG